MTTVVDPEHTEKANDCEADPLRIRYRIRFAKRDLLRWISHRDLARLWERLIRRADLKLSMTQGFHPKPRVGFPSALALGVESQDEVVELELAEELTADELLKRLQDDQQPGLFIKSVSKLPQGFGKAQLLHTDYVITLPETADAAATTEAIEKLLTQETAQVERKKKTLTVKVTEQISRLELVDGLLHLTLLASDSASLRPGDVLDLIDASDWSEEGSLITRTKVVLQREYEADDPATVAIAESNNEPKH